MNKKIIAILILVLLVYSNCFSQSQKLYFAFDGGINKLIRDYNARETGFVTGVKVGYILSNNFISGLKVDYKSNNPTDIKTDENSLTYVQGGQSIDLGIKAYFMYGNFKNEFQIPYVLVGAGIDIIKTASGETVETGSFKGTRPLINVGIDIALGMGFRVQKNTSVYIQPEFTNSFSNATLLKSSIAVKAGLMFSF